jgi:hypothetical protein
MQSVAVTTRRKLRRTTLILVLAAGARADDNRPTRRGASPVPELPKLTSRPDTTDFSKLNMHEGRPTLCAQRPGPPDECSHRSLGPVFDGAGMDGHLSQ